MAFLSACQAHTVRCGCTWCIDDVSCLLLAFQSCVTTWCSHVAKAASSCFAVLRQLRSIQRSVSDPVLQSLVVALVLTKLDYGSATSAGLNMAPRYLTSQLCQASNVGYWQHLCLSSSAKLDVPRTEHMTIGGYAFRLQLVCGTVCQ